jgi:arylsulfatase A-like enzyme
MAMQKLKRRSFIGSGIALAGAAPFAGAAPNRPNILFIITDQQTAGALGCAGNPYVKTPNMDALAARGVRFAKSYSTNPVCCPARASFFTSRMPHELGILANANADLSSKGVPTMGELFRQAGYKTAYAGKWHPQMPYPAYRQKPIPGFDVLPLAGKDPGTVDHEKEGKGLTADPNAADAAIHYLQQKHDKPFLLVASLLNPHDICEYGSSACEALKSLLPEDPNLLPPARPNMTDTETLPPGLQMRVESRSELEWREYLYVYYRLVEIVDAEIGRILAALENSGRAKDTVVLYTSDHGEMMGSHSMRVKSKLYEEAVAVPLVVAPPGCPARVDTRHLVNTLDVLPTLLDYAGIAAPGSLEGHSLRPLVEQKSVEWRDHVVSEANTYFQARMVRTDRYKYILFDGAAPNEQFFDMVQDPGELRNRIGNPELQTEVSRHRALLKSWMAKTNDAFSEPPKRGGKGKKKAAKAKT